MESFSFRLWTCKKNYKGLNIRGSYGKYLVTLIIGLNATNAVIILFKFINKEITL